MYPRKTMPLLAALLATLVGFSVLIPYIGAAVATIPVALVAFFQFGWGWDFGQVIIAYLVRKLQPLTTEEVLEELQQTGEIPCSNEKT